MKQLQQAAGAIFDYEKMTKKSKFDHTVPIGSADLSARKDTSSQRSNQNQIDKIYANELLGKKHVKNIRYKSQLGQYPASNDNNVFKSTMQQKPSKFDDMVSRPNSFQMHIIDMQQTATKASTNNPSAIATARHNHHKSLAEYLETPVHERVSHQEGSGGSTTDDIHQFNHIQNDRSKQVDYFDQLYKLRQIQAKRKQASDLKKKHKGSSPDSSNPRASWALNSTIPRKTKLKKLSSTQTNKDGEFSRPHQNNLSQSSLSKKQMTTSINFKQELKGSKRGLSYF